MRAKRNDTVAKQALLKLKELIGVNPSSAPFPILPKLHRYYFTTTATKDDTDQCNLEQPAQIHKVSYNIQIIMVKWQKKISAVTLACQKTIYSKRTLGAHLANPRCCGRTRLKMAKKAGRRKNYDCNKLKATMCTKNKTRVLGQALTYTHLRTKWFNLHLRSYNRHTCKRQERCKDQQLQYGIARVVLMMRVPPKA